MHAELFHGDRCLRFIKDQAKYSALGESGNLRCGSRHLDDAYVFGIDSQLFQRHQQGHVIGCAKAADGQRLASEICGFFDFGANDQFSGEEIKPSPIIARSAFVS